MERRKICKIRDIYRAIAALEAEIDRLHGLNINEAMLLCTLHEHGRLTVGAVREELGLSYSNTSKVIDSVEKQALLRRSMQEGDHRHICVELTDAGRRRLEAMKSSEMDYPEILKPILDC